MRKLAALTLLLSTPAFAANPPYIFTPLADSTGPFATFQNAAINNNGLVAFKTTLDNGNNAIYIAGVHTAPALVALQGASLGSGDSISSFSTEVDINDNGLVVFTGSGTNFFSYVARASAGSPITALSTHMNSQGIGINNSGFVSYIDTIGNNNAVVANNGTTSTTIASDSASSTILQGLKATAINNNGAVTFLAADSLGGHIFSTANGPTPTSLADTSGPYKSFGGVAENNAGTVVSLVANDDNSTAIRTFSSSGATTVIATQSTFKSFVGTPAINDNGTVIFYATDPNSHVGLFTGPDPVANKILAAGDPLFGSTVSSFFSLADALNNSGQITFRANLANGINYIVLASPASPGDANADGRIDLSDLATVLNHFGTPTSAWASGNFDGQPTIDLADLSFVLTNFGATNPGLSNAALPNAAPSLLAAPEAATLPLTLAAITLLITSRRNRNVALASRQ